MGTMPCSLSTDKCAPRSTPHMVLPSLDHSLVAVSYTTDKYVHIIDAHTRTIVDSLGVPHIENAKIHTGTWYRLVGELYFVTVDMTGAIDGAAGGGGLHLWKMIGSGAILLDSWSAPNALGMLANETKPIAAGGNHLHANGLLYVTDAKLGGGYFVNISSGVISLVNHVSVDQLAPDCSHGGGLWVYAHPTDPSIVVAQYGTQSPGESCVAVLNIQDATLVDTIALSENANDAHGLAFCQHDDGSGQTKTYLLNTNRVSGTLDIIDYDMRTFVSKDIDLNLKVSNSFATNDETCTEDVPLLARRYQPDVLTAITFDAGNPEIGTVYQPSRGRHPKTAVLPQNRLPYAAPGLYSFSVIACTTVTRLQQDISLPAYNAKTTVNAADPHGANLVGDEVWMIDQAPTGSTIYCDDKVIHFASGALEGTSIPCPSSYPPSPPIIPPGATPLGSMDVV